MEKIQYFFIPKEESKNILEKNNLKGKYSINDCNVRISYKDENDNHQIEYGSRELVINHITGIRNKESIKFAGNTKETNNQYNEYVFKSENQKITVIVPIENQKLIDEDYTYKDHSIDEYTKKLDNLVDNIVRTNRKKIFKRILAGLAIAGTIAGGIHIVAQQTKKNIEMQSQTNTYDKYYRGIVPERQFEELVKGLQNDEDHFSYRKGK